MKTDKQNIARQIKLKKKNTLLNHFLSMLLMRYKMSGEILDKRIILWEVSPSIGPMYPMCKIDFDDTDSITSIKSELNKLGKILYVAISTVFLLFGVHIVLNLKDSNLIIPQAIAAALIALLFRAFKWVNDKAKKELASFIISKSKLNSEDFKSVVTIGSPFKKLLFRTYFYLFFIFLFCISFYNYLNSGSWHQIIGIILDGCFVITESIFLYKNRIKVNKGCDSYTKH